LGGKNSVYRCLKAILANFYAFSKIFSIGKFPDWEYPIWLETLH
jgi:hypothetical protein